MPNIQVDDKRIADFIKLFEGDVDAAVQALRTQTSEQNAKRRKPVRAATGPVLIKAENLTKAYKIGKQHIAALNDVSLEVREGEFVVFTGPSGSGKSTLLQLIGGLDKADTGSVVVDGKDLTTLNDRALSHFRNRTIGFVFQFFYLQPFLRLQANLEVPGMFARTKYQERAEHAKELATGVGLDDRLTHLPKELSGGQMQRAAIARALLNRPKLLLADEPTGNLDSANGAAIINLFKKINKEFGTTIIVVTHDPKVAEQADREIVLKDGVIQL